jgi:protein-S-isoprenylcysteine O-methyltransferase Ste14
MVESESAKGTGNMSVSVKPASLGGFNLSSEPAHSGYFWNALALSFACVLGICKLAVKVSQNHQFIAIAAPILVIAPILLVWQAVRTTGIIRTARIQENVGNEQSSRLAYQSFRSYILLTAIVAAVTWLLVSQM